MKAFFWLSAILLSSIISFAQKPIQLTGKLNWKEKKDLMIAYSLDGQDIKDTIIAVNGTFKKIFMVSGPTLITIADINPNAKGARDNKSLYTEGGKVSIIGNDSLTKSKVTGGLLTNEYEALTASIAPHFKMYFDNRMKALKMPVAERKGPVYDAMNKEDARLVDSMLAIKVAFIKNHPNSYISLITLKEIAGAQLNYDFVNPLLQSLSANIKEKPEAIEFAKALTVAKKTNTGEIMPDFNSLDTLRNPLKLSDVVKKGKITMVDFWAAWCKPCRAENPNVVKAFNAFHNKGFNIISVSLDQSEKDWKKAINADGMPWYHVSSLKYWKEPIALELGINALPDNFLLDENGRVIARGLKGELLYKKLEELLKN